MQRLFVAQQIAQCLAGRATPTALDGDDREVGLLCREAVPKTRLQHAAPVARVPVTEEHAQGAPAGSGARRRQLLQHLSDVGRPARHARCQQTLQSRGRD